MTHCVLKNEIVQGIEFKVCLLEDKRYSVTIIGGGNVFSFIVDNEEQLQDVATKFSALDNYFAIEHQAIMENQK